MSQLQKSQSHVDDKGIQGPTKLSHDKNSKVKEQEVRKVPWISCF